jgi:hypothetical protein
MERIYILDTYQDIPEYEGFGWASGHRSHRFQVKQHRDGTYRPWDLEGLWFNDEVIGRVRAWNDLPMMSGVPIFSSRAVNVLGEMLSRNGELLPVKTGLGEYFAFNSKRVFDCLDVEGTTFDISAKEMRSDIEAHSIDIRSIDIFKIVEGVVNEGIFRIKYINGNIFVNHIFVEQINEHHLNGFNFIPIWPNDGQTHWWKQANEHREYCERKAKNFRRKHKGDDAPPLDPVEISFS